MKIVKNIFARIWCLWALISFITTFLIIFIPSMFSYAMEEVKGQKYFIRISRCWMRVWLFLIGCPVTVTGKENFFEGQNYIVVFNHNALLDVPLSSPFVPGANKTIAKASFAKVPLFGWFYSKGSVLVDRKNDKSRSKSIDAMKAVLLSGMHMCIYPEGTRNRTNEPLKKFYDGAFILSINTQKEIIPCIITGTKKATPIDKFFYLLPTQLKMHFLPAVSPLNTTAAALNQKVFLMMKDYYVKSAEL
ncbi:MAG: lysophospholipid acyltransferase family protein [Ferruginibacter sp.]